MTYSMYYQISIKESLSRDWLAWFDPLTIEDRPGGETMLAGVLPDQAALHGILARIRDLGLTLVALSTRQDMAGR
jgi:hypothetical protein